ncbi:MAG: aromatic ring-hydroxylating dioxygenase subunit alpha [Chitinophagaceae bacterium]|nr:aromatic ring-hydroxylating dioxygenase subunit alpha [Chitinophagaceae bacterium]
MSNKNLIYSKYYCNPELAELEFNNIFSKEWFFAAMDDELDENNKFITVNIFNYPIVLQNFKGDVRAFKNICPHRFNLIQKEKSGKRPFVCEYHSWSFDIDGKPITRSLIPLFNTEEESFKKACVKRLNLEKVGKFYFVNLSENPTIIKEYLGGFYDKLIEISNAITTKHYFEEDSQNINWKIIIENVIEAYHCPSIHKNTLMNMGFCRVPEKNQEYYNGHSVADYPKNEDYQTNKMLQYLDKRTYKHDTFKHFFIFPNLLISSTEGTSIYIGNILPISSEKSILRKRFYDVKFQEGFEPKISIHNAFLEMVRTSINSILLEDKVILEQIQKNMKFVKEKYILGNQEQRIVNFHNHYLNLIK